MTSCILYQREDEGTYVTLLDIPRSIELAQAEPGPGLKIISSKPLQHPYPSVEPKSASAKAKLGEVPIEELLLQRQVEIALESIKEIHAGEWCLPRATEEPGVLAPEKKRKREASKSPADEPEKLKDVPKTPIVEVIPVRFGGSQENQAFVFQNTKNEPAYIRVTPGEPPARVPPQSTALCGDITTTVSTFNMSAPVFELIIMDPPWPNRSARRKNSYSISYSTAEIRALLSSIPICDHLAKEGFVAVWVTNKPAFRDMLLEEGGLFDEWGIELVEEWVWVKVTASGETICELDSVWRKPYEILLVGRRKQAEKGVKREIKKMVVVGVPDLHSRKPNLKILFERLVGRDTYDGLEIFARNLTAGWWSWGNEVLKFQAEEYWTNQFTD
ncbi:uncharacterized protein BP5553_08885 [Venustampulla echinocandica]|uniref:MT-A70-domain-containing protein n=1 Tax=Venustampulla echinocandica TaxID=2656787 RepID=A0A370TD79_9HELO|nr:uncharacterized protein BP5553_08885 [Venustampulla echinocandica]RDL32429.1 hypothetical protein BP5553_08885 [Venustampulla echinocandica]